ncbi:MAG: ABC transporter permease [Ignavibacteriales bacterium]|nr:ABC transporter permease [Ignavibacteriales bacterium]
MLFVFYGSIYYNKVETNVEISIMDLDNSATSNKLIRYLDSHQSISVTGKISNLEEGNKELISEESKAIVCFPKGFEETLKKGKRGEIKIYLNGTRFLVSNDLNKAINEVIGYANAGISLKYFETKGYNRGQAVEMIDPIKMDVRPLFNFTESYGDFLIPAVLVLILQQTLLIGLSESIAKERETNSFEGLSRLANWNPNLLIQGKGLFYMFLFGSYGFFFFIINFYVFKIPNRGEFIPLFIFTSLLILSVIYLSIFISSFFHRKNSFTSIFNINILSGVFNFWLQLVVSIASILFKGINKYNSKHALFCSFYTYNPNGSGIKRCPAGIDSLNSTCNCWLCFSLF